MVWFFSCGVAGAGVVGVAGVGGGEVAEVIVVVVAAGLGYLLGDEGAEREDEGDGGMCEGGRFEVWEMGPFEACEDDWRRAGGEMVSEKQMNEIV